MTKEKIFKRVYARELLIIAEGDLASAEVLAATPLKGRKENTCYTGQQSIEKAIKAVICAQGTPVPLTHSLELLLDKITGTAPPHDEALIDLTDFATVKRSQEGNEIITDADISATIDAARAVLKWAQQEVDQLLLQANLTK